MIADTYSFLTADCRNILQLGYRARFVLTWPTGFQVKTNSAGKGSGTMKLNFLSYVSALNKLQAPENNYVRGHIVENNFPGATSVLGSWRRSFEPDKKAIKSL